MFIFFYLFIHLLIHSSIYLIPTTFVRLLIVSLSERRVMFRDPGGISVLLSGLFLRDAMSK